jgi:hypothetical protein
VEWDNRGSGGATETDKKLWNRTTVEVAEPQKQTKLWNGRAVEVAEPQSERNREGGGANRKRVKPWRWRSHIKTDKP